MRKLFCIIALLAAAFPVWGQTGNPTLERAERIYQYFLNEQGDSIHAALRTDLQAELSPAVFEGVLTQMERQFGKLQSADTWQEDKVDGQAFCHRDLKFEKYTLRFLLSFEDDGALNTIRLMPAPAPPAPPIRPDSTLLVEREVTVESDGFRLPGTLTLPKEAVEAGRAVPCVVMVHGSGPQDRDETIGPNKPFRDLAWGLAAQGIASLRYDKRTLVYGAVYLPEGREADMDVETCDDALAALGLARTFPEVAADSLFVLGHSQGGTMAPRIALRAGDGVAGIIILAGLARPMEDAIVEQSVYIASLSGHEDAPQLKELKRQADNVKRLGTPAFCDSIPLPLGVPKSYWEFLRKNPPLPDVAALALPVLVLQGERDYQVTMQDYSLWLMALLGNHRAQLKSYPALNHILQEGTGKSTPMEYNEARPVPAYVWEDVAGFIRGKDIR